MLLVFWFLVFGSSFSFRWKSCRTVIMWTVGLRGMGAEGGAGMLY